MGASYRLTRSKASGILPRTTEGPRESGPSVLVWVVHVAAGHRDAERSQAVLDAHLFGDNYRFADHTHDSRGLAPRSFALFLDAANEAAISRLYGVIHFRAAIDNGVARAA